MLATDLGCGDAATRVHWPSRRLGRLRRAQETGRMQRLAVLMNTGVGEPEAHARLAAFMQDLQEFGWAVGRNMRIDYHWTSGDAVHLRKSAEELVALRRRRPVLVWCSDCRQHAWPWLEPVLRGVSTITLHARSHWPTFANRKVERIGSLTVQSGCICLAADLLTGLPI
jgi:hypothetical protein